MSAGDDLNEKVILDLTRYNIIVENTIYIYMKCIECCQGKIDIEVED